MKRIIRTNQWHAVSVRIERNDSFAPRAEEVRINSDPANLGASAYLTPDKARALARLLVEVARRVERTNKRIAKRAAREGG